MNYGEVVLAANELKRQGIKPTVNSVRKIIGRGSNRDITPLLRQWKYEEIFSSCIEEQSNSKESLPGMIVDFIENEKKEVWKKLKDEVDRLECELAYFMGIAAKFKIASDEWRKKETNFVSRICELKAILNQYKETCNILNELVDEWKKKYFDVENKFAEYLIKKGSDEDRQEHIELIRNYNERKDYERPF